MNKRNDWENPQVTGINKLPAHVNIVPCPDVIMALRGNQTDSPFFLSLNDRFHFNLTRTPQDAPKNFYDSSFDAGYWDTIDVPGNWTLQGYDKPIGFTTLNRG